MNIKQLSETIHYSESSIRSFIKQGMRYTLINGKIDISYTDWSDFDLERKKRKLGRPVKHKNCVICGGLHIAKGLCSKCYARKRREK